MKRDQNYAARFAAKLRRWRGQMSVKEAAFVLGIPYSTYYAYETGERSPHPNHCACCIEKKMLLAAPALALPIALPRPTL